VNPLFDAAADIHAFCSARHWKTAIIGGFAVQRWGEPRQTRDVDLTLLTGFGGESAFIDALLERYVPRRTDAREFALKHRVLLVESSEHIPFDISLAALPFEERVIERSSEYSFDPSCTVTTCSAEDLVVLKAFADRPQDWLDIEGVVVRQGAALNRALVIEELTALLELKEDPDPGLTLRRLFKRHP
jgi:hypothetical protein